MESRSKRPNSLKRSRVLKRKGIRFETFEHGHIPYAWAAYKRGALNIIPDLDQDMDASMFSAWLVERLSPTLQAGGQVITMFAETSKHGEIPVGLAVIEYHNGIAWPHALWFPDATPRNRLELGIAFLIELKKNQKVLITAERENEHYFNHICKYGVIRKVGKWRDWFENGHAMLYQNVGH